MARITAEMDTQISTVRDFNRFYVRRIGLLEGGLVKGAFSLTQLHILYELAHNEGLTAARLGRDLGLDPGYLSRILKKFEAQKLIVKTPSKEDGRQAVLAMTPEGRIAFAPVEDVAREQIADLLTPLSANTRTKVISAMRVIHRALDKAVAPTEPYLLRPVEQGDIGWITYRHGILYHEEYGWDETFEAMVANILADFVTSYDPKRERAWIAEREGEVIGSIFCTRETDACARLGVFFVEPSARGLGIGRRLVDECIRFARSKGYQTVTLRTKDVLTSARHIYEAAGFTLTSEERNHEFGKDLVSQDWQLKL